MKTIKDKLKEHFDNTPVETIKNEWKSTEVYDKSNSPKASYFLKEINDIIGDNHKDDIGGF